VQLLFPVANRGPLDLFVQMRGYDNFADDTMENPKGVRLFDAFLPRMRVRFNVERAAYLGEPLQKKSSYIAMIGSTRSFTSPQHFRDLMFAVLPRHRSGGRAGDKFPYVWEFRGF